MSEVTASSTPRSAAFSMIRTVSLDEAAHRGRGEQGSPPPNWAMYEELTASLEGWEKDGALRENSLRLVEWLAVELACYLSLQLGRDQERVEQWLREFGDQVCRAQQHPHPAGPSAIEILSVVVEVDARAQDSAGAERLVRIGGPFLSYLRAGHELDDAREMALSLGLWAGDHLAQLLGYEAGRIASYLGARDQAPPTP